LVRSKVRRVRKACSSLDLSENPLPDPGSWEEIADPERHLRAVLSVLASITNSVARWPLRNPLSGGAALVGMNGVKTNLAS